LRGPARRVFGRLGSVLCLFKNSSESIDEIDNGRGFFKQFQSEAVVQKSPDTGALHPASASWPNMMDPFFQDLTHNPLRGGVFPDPEELIMTVESYIDGDNEKSQALHLDKHAQETSWRK
jgi:hypothetical protein